MNTTPTIELAWETPEDRGRRRRRTGRGRVMRPPFPYFGGKMTLAATIADLLPEHRHYVEPYAGSLAVLLAKRPAVHETVNDLNGDIITFWRVLRDHPEDLVRACEDTPHARAEYAAAYDRPVDLDDVERARRIWVCLTQGRSGTLRRTGWRHFEKPDSATSMPGYLDAYISRMREVADRIRRVSLECREGIEVIAAYGEHADVCLYVDPPYLGTTRTRNYQTEMTSEAQHRALAGALHGCSASVVLSGYASPLYDDLYDGWHRLKLDAFTGQGNRNGRRVEVLWSNRHLTATLPFDELAGGAS